MYFKHLAAIPRRRRQTEERRGQLFCRLVADNGSAMDDVTAG